MNSYSLRVFGPKTSESPTVGARCLICQAAFVVGDLTCLLDLYPADIEELSKMIAQESYTSEAVEIHSQCAKKLGYEIDEG